MARNDPVPGARAPFWSLRLQALCAELQGSEATLLAAIACTAAAYLACVEIAKRRFHRGRARSHVAAVEAKVAG